MTTRRSILAAFAATLALTGASQAEDLLRLRPPLRSLDVAESRLVPGGEAQRPHPLNDVSLRDAQTAARGADVPREDFGVGGRRHDHDYDTLIVPMQSPSCEFHAERVDTAVCYLTTSEHE